MPPQAAPKSPLSGRFSSGGQGAGACARSGGKVAPVHQQPERLDLRGRPLVAQDDRDIGNAQLARGFEAQISTEFAVPLPESACVYCGNCIGVCPTGALIPRREHEMRQAGTWDEAQQTRTDTICPYCGVGCTLTLHVQDNQIVKATSPLEHDIGHGHLCIKGRFGWQFVQADLKGTGDQ